MGLFSKNKSKSKFLPQKDAKNEEIIIKEKKRLEAKPIKQIYTEDKNNILQQWSTRRGLDRIFLIIESPYSDVFSHYYHSIQEAENFEFLKNYSDYKKEPTIDKWKSMYTNFIKLRSKNEINISSAMRNEFDQIYLDASPNQVTLNKKLDEVAQEIYNLLYQNLNMKFKEIIDSVPVKEKPKNLKTIASQIKLKKDELVELPTVEGHTNLKTGRAFIDPDKTDYVVMEKRKKSQRVNLPKVQDEKNSAQEKHHQGHSLKGKK